MNQNWAGHPGWHQRSWTPAGEKKVTEVDSWMNKGGSPSRWNAPLETMQVWCKPQPGGALAVLVVNAGAHEQPYSVALDEIVLPGGAHFGAGVLRLRPPPPPTDVAVYNTPYPRTAAGVWQHEPAAGTAPPTPPTTDPPPLTPPNNLSFLFMRLSIFASSTTSPH